MTNNGPTGGKSTAARQVESASQLPTVTVHVVCRECTFEQLAEGHSHDAAIAAAMEARIKHAADTGHIRTVPGVIDDPTCQTCGEIPLTTTVTGPDAEDATHDCGHTPVEVTRR